MPLPTMVQAGTRGQAPTLRTPAPRRGAEAAQAPPVPVLPVSPSRSRMAPPSQRGRREGSGPRSGRACGRSGPRTRQYPSHESIQQPEGLFLTLGDEDQVSGYEVHALKGEEDA